MRHLKVLQTHADTLERARFALRVAVCRRCAARPAGSELLGADVPRTCEKQCPLFSRLPCLLLMARCIDPLVGSFDRIMEGHLRRLARRDPLRFANDSQKAPQPPHAWSHHLTRIIHILRNLTGN